MAGFGRVVISLQIFLLFKNTHIFITKKRCTDCVAVEEEHAMRISFRVFVDHVKRMRPVQVHFTLKEKKQIQKVELKCLSES